MNFSKEIICENPEVDVRRTKPGNARFRVPDIDLLPR
jgi:hypothetical protein